MSATTPNQLILGIRLDDAARFENYLISSANQQAATSLSSLDEADPYTYIWGTGLTHLLQAVCHQYTMADRSAIYLPLAEKSQLSPEILIGANTLSLVCIDDVDQLDGDEKWEAALFTAFNAMAESDTRLIVAAKSAPQSLSVNLADLHSRLQSGLVFQLLELSDTEKLAALQLRARHRGMDLSDSVAEFILLRAERNLTTLMEILDKLDASSLQEQRSLTIPLVKSTLGW